MVTPQRLLAVVVDRYDRVERPLSASEVASATDADLDAIHEHLQRLVDCELLCRENSGVRPTVTGREFLDLDVDPDSIVVVEIPDECE